MRLRNLKNKEEIINGSSYVVRNIKDYKEHMDRLFGNDNPIYVEIGMGRGKFIYNNAISNTDINYIGIEKQDNILARALKWIPEGVLNLKVIRGNALEIDEYFDKDIDKLFLNFSDPWPKKRQAGRRLTSPIFLDKYEKIFKDKKEIEIRTDNEELFIYSIEMLSAHKYTLYDVTFDLHKDSDDLITTEYEDKFSENGNKIYSLKAIK